MVSYTVKEKQKNTSLNFHSAVGGDTGDTHCQLAVESIHLKVSVLGVVASAPR